MSHFTEEEINKAKEMDLLTYLKNYEPNNLVHISRDTYCTRDHDSLKINNGKWYWFSRGVGGYTALDYLMKVRDYTFPQAVSMVLTDIGMTEPIKYKEKPKENRRLLLPERNYSSRRACNYLRSRGIHPKVIQYCLYHDLFYESKDKYHNIVFLGRNKYDEIRYATIRGTKGKYKSEATGSDKRWSFSVTGNDGKGDLHVFEAAIDLLSYMSLMEMKGQDWSRDSFLSLAGVFEQKRDAVLPVALKQYLQDHEEIRKIHLHLDNDEVGKEATKGIIRAIGEQYAVIDEPPECGKDVNDELMIKTGLAKSGREDMQR